MPTTSEVQRLVNKLWTVSDLARRVKRTPMTIHVWRQQGLPAVVIKGSTRPAVRFVPDDTRVWVKRERGISVGA